jgi:hypothetical protein
MPNYITCSFCGNDKDFKFSLGTQYRLNLAKKGQKSNVVVKWHSDSITCLKCGASAKINEKF